VANETAPNPLDHATSYDIASSVAQITNLPEKIAIKNQAESARAITSLSADSTNIVTKPQVVATALKSRGDIQKYKVQKGDNVSSVAKHFGISADSIRWSNGLTGNDLGVGETITIPPLNGIVYTVKSGDTAASLASKFSVSKNQIISYNDAELAGLKAGEQIIIPGARQEQTVTSRYGGARSFVSSYAFKPIYSGNGYDPGQCTWYVASVVSVPNNWGNANTWALLAPYSGWKVSSTPRVGAIAQTTAGWAGHVAYVRAVQSDGSVWISEMNAYGQVSMTDTRSTGGPFVVDYRHMPASAFTYIYR
jgi:surface antigen